jgi:hypothetical protein
MHASAALMIVFMALVCFVLSPCFGCAGGLAKRRPDLGVDLGNVMLAQVRQPGRAPARHRQQTRPHDAIDRSFLGAPGMCQLPSRGNMHFFPPSDMAGWGVPVFRPSFRGKPERLHTLLHTASR